MSAEHTGARADHPLVVWRVPPAAATLAGMTLVALLAVLALTGSPTTTCDAARRCVTTEGGQIVSVCVTRGIVRTCTHYRDGRAVRHCVRTAGRNRCTEFQVAWSGVRAAPGDR